MQVLHAMSMHGSLTEHLKSTDLNQLDSSQDNTRMVRNQIQPSHKQLQVGLAMNPRYEYKLPRGLGLAVHGRTDGAETAIASEIGPHDPNDASEDNGSADTLRAPSEIHVMLPQHSVGLEIQTCSGVSNCSPSVCTNRCCQDVTHPILSGRDQCRPRIATAVHFHIYLRL